MLSLQINRLAFILAFIIKIRVQDILPSSANLLWINLVCILRLREQELFAVIYTLKNVEKGKAKGCSDGSRVWAGRHELVCQKKKRTNQKHENCSLDVMIPSFDLSGLPGKQDLLFSTETILEYYSVE